MRADLRSIFACALMTCCAQAARAESRPIVFLGTFYSERFTQEHEYLDQIDLWGEDSLIFGLTSSIAGLVGDQAPLLSRFEGVRRDKSVEFSNGFRGTLEDSLLLGVEADDPEFKTALRRSDDRMSTNAARAPRSGYEAWRAWADSLIDHAEANEPYMRQEETKCEQGDGWACVGIGNRVEYRKPVEARRYWERGCELDAWPGCRFIGDEVRSHSILLRLCSSNQSPSLYRTMACQDLGGEAEKAGRIEEAVRWYRIGCTPNSLPTTCCKRLEQLQHTPRPR